MRYFQNSKNLLPPRILSVTSQDSYARLLRLSSTGKEFIFELTYKLILNNPVGNVLDYEKITVQAKKKYSESLRTTVDNQIVKSDLQRKVNPFTPVSSSRNKLINAFPGTPLSIYPKKVSDKLYSGIKSTNDLGTKEDFLSQETFFVGKLLSNSLSSVYSYVQLEKPLFVEGQTQNNQIISDEILDPNDVASFINKNFFTLSQYDEIDVNSWSTPQRLIFDYLANRVDKKPSDEKVVVHRAVKKTGALQEIIVPVQISIPVEYENLNLDVICSLYKTGASTAEEVIINDLHIPSLVEEYESLVELKSVPTLTVSSEGSKHYLTINFSGNAEERNKLSGYNLYKRVLEKSGKLDEFVLLANITTNNPSTTFIFSSSYPLEIIRVVPVYKNSKESHVFRDVVIGTKYSMLGTMSITSYNVQQFTTIQVHNVPRGTKYIELYKRNCADFGSEFKLVNSVSLNTRVRNVTLSDSTPEVGTFEYFVAAFIPDETSTSRDKILISNYIAHECVQFEDTKEVSVTISEISNNSQDKLNPSFSFNITTNLISSESQKITEGLQTQIVELYNKYVNPQNLDNPAVTGNQLAPGVPKYSDLFFHEVIRTNMDTGEREVFEMIGEGRFEDSNASRSKKGLKRLDPQNTYLYQVFTYTRNPIELFKNFVAHGTRTGAESNGKEWFYLPYKWLSPQVKRGILYANDKEGVPIISENESLKAKTHGLTSTYELKGIKDYASVDQVVANRLTNKTVKISWEFNISSIRSSTSIVPYDSYMVMAVVNGKKKYIGTTRTNFMYHSLEHNNSNIDRNDYGTIYYIIIPILKQLFIDAPAYSNELVIDPSGLHDVVKLPNTVLENKLKPKLTNR